MINQIKYSRFWGILTVIIILVLAWKIEPINVKIDDTSLANTASLLGTLILLSLFVERAIEVFLSAWRSAGADELDRNINNRKLAVEKYLQMQPQSTAVLKSEHYNHLVEQLENIEKERARYRAHSRMMSKWLGLGIGMLLAFVGVRIIGNILDASALSGYQKTFFMILDIVFTGAVLAGGSDPINRAMKAYNHFMTPTSQLASRDKTSQKH
ncbi:hypothetical protein HQQ94_12705 [Shewanella sp. VB17]|uniref:hypothetical protein n=1 Tax=Shewanella sp. VB17 TaxID=2739432 RepID=UPI001567471A|nr:hypothetical protein [Shewanella sp. VB17]NRD74080.1 hypothetical protein [Shewanella sp. VB17]